MWLKRQSISVSHLCIKIFINFLGVNCIVMSLVSAPPSYAECVSGKVNIRDEADNEYTGGNLEFTPRYTYYDWGVGDGSNKNPK